MRKNKFHSILIDELIEAQSKCDEIKLFIAPTQQSIKLIKIDGLYCEDIKKSFEAIGTQKFDIKIFKSVHEVGSPGGRTTLSNLTQRFVWPGIKKDCADWTKKCLDCQKKIKFLGIILHRFRHLPIIFRQNSKKFMRTSLVHFLPAMENDIY